MPGYRFGTNILAPAGNECAPQLANAQSRL